MDLLRFGLTRLLITKKQQMMKYFLSDRLFPSCLLLLHCLMFMHLESLAAWILVH